MSIATKKLGLDPALAELAAAAEEFGLGEIVDDLTDQVDNFVDTGREWAKKTQEIMQRTGEHEWTPVKTGNIAASIDTDEQLPTIAVGVNVAKITKPTKGDKKSHSDAGKDYTEYENVGTKTGHGPDFIEAVWFEYAKSFGSQLFPNAFKEIS